MFFKILSNKTDTKQEATKIIKKAKEEAAEILREAREKAGGVVKKKIKKADKIAQKQADKVKELKVEIKTQRKELEISEKKIESLENQLRLFAEKNSKISELESSLEREIKLRKETENEMKKVAEKEMELDKDFPKEIKIVLAHLKKEKKELEGLKTNLISLLKGDLSVRIPHEEEIERKVISMIEEIEKLEKEICKPSG